VTTFQDSTMRSCLRQTVATSVALVVSVSVASLAVAVQSSTLSAQGLQRPGLPARLSDAEFWSFVRDVSEPGGSFSSDNFTSNEMGFPQIVSDLHASNTSGGVYLGVGPEQNFSYIASIQPKIAFIVDIRRQAVMQHLMYKAIFELSKDRADFVSLLFSKPRPAGLDSSTTIANIWEAYWMVPTDTVVYPKNLVRIKDQLTKTHGFALDSADLSSLTYVYEAFYRLGPIISYSGYGLAVSGNWTVAGIPGVFMGPVIQGRVAGVVVTRSSTSGGATSTFTINGGTAGNLAYYGGVDFAALTAATDATGYAASFLGTEENYRFMKDFESKNLLIPVVGDFAGPKAIRGVGQYVRDHGATITAFYTSNVEQYLFQADATSHAFYENVATLPVTPASVFIRNGLSICPIQPFLAAVTAGRVTRYADATACVQ